MPGPTTYLPGERYGMLVILSEAERSPSGARRVLCQCDCGGTSTPTASSLAKGARSCGCLKRRKNPAEETPLRTNMALVVDVIREDGIRLYVVECPFCQELHRHAVPDDVLPSAELSRTAKCKGRKALGRSYQLVTPEEESEAA